MSKLCVLIKISYCFVAIANKYIFTVLARKHLLTAQSGNEICMRLNTNISVCAQGSTRKRVQVNYCIHLTTRIAGQLSTNGSALILVLF